MEVKHLGLILNFSVVLIFSVGEIAAINEFRTLQIRSSENFNRVQSKRTFLGEAVLLPIFATIGLKVLALLPIILSKIAVLSVMNFFSSNLNLFITTFFNLKSILGKFGLWPQEQSKYYGDYEPFNDWPGQQILQPNLRYQYYDPLAEGYEAYKAPKVVRVLNGYIPNDPMALKASIDRKFRTDGKTQKLRHKEQNGQKTPGKYICYWTSGSSDSKTQPQPDAIKKQEFSTRRTIDITNAPDFHPFDKRRELDRYKEYNSLMNPAIRDMLLAPGYQDQQYMMNSNVNYDDALAYQQQMHFQNSMQNNENAIERGSNSFPFAENAIQVSQSNQGSINTQQPLEYFIKGVDAVTATISIGNIESGH